MLTGLSHHIDGAFHDLGLQGYLSVNAFHGICIEPIEIVFHGGNEHAPHFDNCGADHDPRIALPEKGVGTVFCAGQDQETPFPLFLEAGDIDHGLLINMKGFFEDIQESLQRIRESRRVITLQDYGLPPQISRTVEEDAVNLRHQKEFFVVLDFFLDGHLPRWDSLEVEVVRGGGAAFRSVVKDCPMGTKITHELEKGIDMVSDGLGMVVYMGDGEVTRENGHWITEDQVFPAIEDPLLGFREVIEAEETWPFEYVFFLYVSQGALDSSRIVLDADGKSIAGDFPHPDVLQRFTALPKIRPCLFLL